MKCDNECLCEVQTSSADLSELIKDALPSQIPRKSWLFAGEQWHLKLGYLTGLASSLGTKVQGFEALVCPEIIWHRRPQVVFAASSELGRIFCQQDRGRPKIYTCCAPKLLPCVLQIGGASFVSRQTFSTEKRSSHWKYAMQTLCLR